MNHERPIRIRLKQWRRRITYSDPFFDWISSLSVFMIKSYLNILKIQRIEHPEFRKLDLRKCLIAFWHGRLLLPTALCGSWNMVIMTDKSFAGETLTRILLKFGHRVVRGSSKRGGFRGVLDMKAVMAKGHGGALAVDGPRGPVYKTKPGVLYLAYKLGYPIVPLTFSADRAWILKKSWDQFMIPKPFSKCRLVVGAPIWETIEKNRYTPEMLDETLGRFTDKQDDKLKGIHQNKSE
jgi:lysophospholipid acyltransferase (LPLAT)-like uncharacterized protein